ncbi:MAG: ribonuclease P protein component [Rhodothermales bacterium]|jgi:ribonuclease P protein component
MSAPRIVSIGSGCIGKGDFIRCRLQFAHVRKHGKARYGQQMIATVVPAPDKCSRLGVIVSKKYNKKAVQRNRARRLMKESYRLLRHGLTTPVWIVLVARKQIADRQLADVQTELVAALLKAGVLDIAHADER